jgi:hypothetical protein
MTTMYGDKMTDQPGQSLFIVERILRDRDGIWRQIIAKQDLSRLLRQMLLSSMVSLACYGAVLGSSKGWLQALSSTVKLPVLFLATLAICLPTLYLFNLVFGARLMMSQAVSLIMVCITVISVLTLAFAPISLFFRITAQSYAFFKLLNIGILLLTAFVGLRFLVAGMQALNAYQESRGTPEPAAVAAPEATPKDPTHTTGREFDVLLPIRVETVSRTAAGSASPQPASMTLLYVWMLLFGFVGTQLAWTLRPFFGSPGEPFEIFRSIEGTFYSDVLRTIGHLLGN